MESPSFPQSYWVEQARDNCLEQKLCHSSPTWCEGGPSFHFPFKKMFKQICLYRASSLTSISWPCSSMIEANLIHTHRTPLSPLSTQRILCPYKWARPLSACGNLDLQSLLCSWLPSSSLAGRKGQGRLSLPTPSSCLSAQWPPTSESAIKIFQRKLPAYFCKSSLQTLSCYHKLQVWIY